MTPSARRLPTILLILLLLALAACAPTAGPAVIPPVSDDPAVSPPSALAQTEVEVAMAMLDFLTRARGEEAAPLAPRPEQPGETIPDDATLILWTAVKQPLPDDALSSLDRDRPIRAWWQWEGNLVEAADALAARDRHRASAEAYGEVYRRLYIEYGITDISEDGQSARVYAGLFCGPLCGSGTTYTFTRDGGGQWVEQESKREMNWIS